ncbi:MAG TPA: bifunctional 2-C-methyl-D-erythritol 4-phosphate cytidylyltransferase/2-C-methyl-D-erythritol 2,4-cyclodiphosphate synthase, partial [Planctomycetes bacterium]|nr:bifunctional 2-C-methyl-D-erythritol 4-phosphate cytidylyltransferase/2-C-methyl-D-erythritol 2,4-cyclodiphosphate synthase [Planctomycetota bacterium]
GLAAVTKDADLVLVHDAVRPFFPPARAREACREALRVGAAILAVPVRDTLKREAGDRRIGETVNRTGLWQAQTPQVFRREVLVSAFKRARALGLKVSDDAQLLEEAGLPVALVPGSVANFKITEPEDLELAEALFQMEMERD